ncbi:DUF485 domain-containing protein [Corynebacterium ammoniagenes]|jgi:uncharacterized membrane protein (DUF485 family)|uniref:Membrane protein n=2 Tax=Corynebacterium ammoniagenes TaxID=1697 RepID=A0AAV5GBF1_CORAM|nr:DUF485 domain-containing protein [Corynebacterium ammoniagenes]APT83155.1 membrane protein [Corynebacterium ammoniagenes DSM 20306]AQS74185.1 hypothetical protein CA40472_09925 [Corynebacterium ammoniagenes]EFG82106.1 hypothetical protein HMPREF0281_00814 [Corynebacterium ammoniagenes DSM 20306]NMF31204.1 DUF485 domain-containing protein [Corynebacterium ammoniagenes]GJN43988.1 membrane protein [Corynebacterium ammoniagenes]
MSGATASPSKRREPSADEFIAMQKSPQFQKLRSTYRKFAFPMTVAFMAWYLLYVVTAVFAHDFMAIEIGGGFNIGLVFGLLQFVTTFLITWLYIQYANKNIEPQAAAIREEMEG